MTAANAVSGCAGSPTGLDVRPASRVSAGGATFSLAGAPCGLRLLVQAPVELPFDFTAFEGEISVQAGDRLLVGPLCARNAEALRHYVAWLAPRPLGQGTSAGMGDRLGLATPGHIRALRAVGGSIAPVLAQQSIRENTRTGRTPRQVLDDAMWGVLEEGWQCGYGADADHLKTTADIDACLDAGFTWFTIDPGAFVHAHPDMLAPGAIKLALAQLPWAALEDSESALWARFARRRFDADGHAIAFDEEALARAAVKYGGAIAHVASMYRHLAAAASRSDFDFEVSVDETDTPTTPSEHFYVARELQRLGVRWTSMAPRLPGRFEKGVDYIGAIEDLEAGLAVHAAIARQLGPYKISLHSGSDKFSIYPAAMRLTRGAVHLKTAGTSYLEALRTLSILAPGLFSEIYRFALDRYETARASYQVSGDLARARRFESAQDDDLPAVLDDFDARQVLHVTFGSVLSARDGQGRMLFADRLFSTLRQHRDAYAAGVAAHLVRHLAPFAVSVA
jgi:tagaturonate epimerase